jgi:hypothetical protein
MGKLDEFRGYADECQRMAERAPTEAEKIQWLRLVQSWLRMIHARDEFSNGATAELAGDGSHTNDQSGQPLDRS